MWILGYNCWGIYDRLGLGFKNVDGLSNADAVKKLDDRLNSDEYIWLEKNLAMEDIAACPLSLLAGSLLQNSTITAQATQNRTLICGNNLQPRKSVKTGKFRNGKEIVFERPQQIQATINIPFETGRPVKAKSDLFDAIKKDGDQRCHIISNVFGGSGAISNFYPCGGQVNGVQIGNLEKNLAQYLRGSNLTSFNFKVTFEYADDAAARPTKMIYEFFDSGGNPIVATGVLARNEFLNP